jgi:hypothetical protein
MNELTIKLPFILQCDDYHEFERITDLFKLLTDEVVKYEEIDTENPYHAVFFIGEKPSDDELVTIKVIELN